VHIQLRVGIGTGAAPPLTLFLHSPSPKKTQRRWPSLFFLFWYVVVLGGATERRHPVHKGNPSSEESARTNRANTSGFKAHALSGFETQILRPFIKILVKFVPQGIYPAAHVLMPFLPRCIGTVPRIPGTVLISKPLQHFHAASPGRKSTS